MKVYFCKSCNSNQKWWQCTNCGQIICMDCAMKGNGVYKKMTSGNKCAYCGYTNKLIHLNGTEDILKEYAK